GDAVGGSGGTPGVITGGKFVTGISRGVGTFGNPGTGVPGNGVVGSGVYGTGLPKFTGPCNPGTLGAKFGPTPAPGSVPGVASGFGSVGADIGGVGFGIYCCGAGSGFVCSRGFWSGYSAGGKYGGTYGVFKL